MGSFVADESVAEEARTRGFATPAFTGCAFVVTNVAAGESTLWSGTSPVKNEVDPQENHLLPHTSSFKAVHETLSAMTP